MAKASPENLQEHIDYQFRDPQLLLEALTHSSYAREIKTPLRDNEQMEFLGDAVLNFLVSVQLANAFPNYPEGMLSRGRARLVGAEHLGRVALNLELGNYLRLGRGEEKTGGRAKLSLMANALEAVMAAIYRDGGIRAARRFVHRFVLPADLAAAAPDLFSIDYKSALQEFLQAGRLGQAVYRVVSEAGPEHRKIFIVEATAGSQGTARGNGNSKKTAEQQAARTLLEHLRRGRHVSSAKEIQPPRQL